MAVSFIGEAIGVVDDIFGAIGGIFGGNAKENQRRRDIARNFLKANGLTIRIEADHENYQSMVYLATLAESEPRVVTGTLNRMFPAGVKLQSPNSAQFQEIVLAINSAIQAKNDGLLSGTGGGQYAGVGGGAPVALGMTAPQLVISGLMAVGGVMLISKGRG